MAKHLLLSVAALLLWANTHAGAETISPDPSTDLQGQVTLSYQDLRRLMDSASDKSRADDSPDLSGSVTDALIRISLDPAQPGGTADFTINTFSHRWVSIPFLGIDLPITGVTPQDAIIVPGEGALCLRTNRPGLTKLTVHFDVPKSFLANAGEQISIRTGPVAYGRLEFNNVPSGKRLLVNGKPMDSEAPVPLPLGGAQTLISWSANEPESPTVWSQTLQMLVKPGTDGAQIESHVQLTGNSGSGLSGLATLPMNATRIEVEGADLRPVQVNTVPGHKELSLGWSTPGILSREIIIRYDLPNPEPGIPWEILPPSISKDSNQATLIVINPLPGTIIRSAAGQDSSDSTLLPLWMQSRLGNSNFRLIRAVAPITVTTEFLPILAVDTARIVSANYQSTLVSDGALKCEAHLTFQYRTAFSWQFKLPEGSALLDCLVKSFPANPVVEPDGELELSIPATTNNGNTESAEVVLSYTARNFKFGPVEGKIHLTLPSTKLFIERLKWQLQLPDSYEPTAFEGNVEPETSEKGQSIIFSQRLLRADIPNLEIYYRKKQLAR
jgi:hypothetical protein